MRRRDSAITSRIMAAVKDRDSKAELTLRRAVHARGFRFRLRPRVTGRPDFVFPSRRIAVFVDGDFWHGNSWRLRGDASLEAHLAKWRNSRFWLKKIRRNVERDREVSIALRRDGWKVLRFWESDIERKLDRCVNKVLRELERRHA